MLFEKLELGDVVLRKEAIDIVTGGWGTGLSVNVVVASPVVRITKAQAVTEDGIRFTRAEGTIIGNSSSGMRGGVYPVGWVNPYGNNAIEKQPMQATSADRVAELRNIAGTVAAFQRRLQVVERNDKNVIKQIMQRAGMTEGAKLIAEATAALDKLLEGFGK